MTSVIDVSGETIKYLGGSDFDVSAVDLSGVNLETIDLEETKVEAMSLPEEVASLPEEVASLPEEVAETTISDDISTTAVEDNAFLEPLSIKIKPPAPPVVDEYTKLTDEESNSDEVSLYDRCVYYLCKF